MPNPKPASPPKKGRPKEIVDPVRFDSVLERVHILAIEDYAKSRGKSRAAALRMILDKWVEENA